MIFKSSQHAINSFRIGKQRQGGVVPITLVAQEPRFSRKKEVFRAQIRSHVFRSSNFSKNGDYNFFLKHILEKRSLTKMTFFTSKSLKYQSVRIQPQKALNVHTVAKYLKTSYNRMNQPLFLYRKILRHLVKENRHTVYSALYCKELHLQK